jgi:hypothetical protein
MYPIVVLLLVETNRSLDTTYFSTSSIIDVRGGKPSQMEPMNFGAGLAFAAGGQIVIENQASQPRANGHDGEPVNATTLTLVLPAS